MTAMQLLYMKHGFMCSNLPVNSCPSHNMGKDAVKSAFPLIPPALRLEAAPFRLCPVCRLRF